MIIIHGENIVASRQRLIKEIDDFKISGGEVLRLEGKGLTLMEVRQALESLSLLGSQRLIIIENLFSGKQSSEKRKILDYLKKLLSNQLIIWEEKKVDGRILNPFKAQVFRFDPAPVIFRFLDSLAPGNARISLNLLHQSLTSGSPEMIFYMLVKQIRWLILAADLGEKGLGNMEDWRKEKLARQAQKFGLLKLLEIYRRLLKIDWQQKTGQTPFDLTSQLDLLLASL